MTYISYPWSKMPARNMGTSGNLFPWIVVTVTLKVNSREVWNLSVIYACWYAIHIIMTKGDIDKSIYIHACLISTFIKYTFLCINIIIHIWFSCICLEGIKITRVIEKILLKEHIWVFTLCTNFSYSTNKKCIAYNTSLF